jgi:hypothetical protein
MEKDLLREKLHRLIEEVDDEIMLENLLMALHGFQQGVRAISWRNCPISSAPICARLRNK